MSLDIIKKESGNVLLEGLDNNPRYEFLQAGQHFRLGRDNDTIEILEKGLVVTSFKYSEVVNTQIEPAAAAPKPSTIKAFLDLLDTSFFFELSGGGDGDSVLTKALVFESYAERTLTSTTHNLSVEGLNDVVTLYLTPTTGLTLSGIVAPNPVKRQFLQVVNLGLSNIVFPEENTNSDPENRFIMQGTSASLSPQQTYLLFYDTLVSRWRVAQTV